MEKISELTVELSIGQMRIPKGPMSYSPVRAIRMGTYDN